MTAYRQTHANRLIADIRTFQHELARFGFQTELSVRVCDCAGHLLVALFQTDIDTNERSLVRCVLDNSANFVVSCH